MFRDAQQALAFAQNQALRINPRVYETRYPDYDFGRLVFVDTAGPEWASGVLTFVSDTVGKAGWYSGAAKDIPLADALMDSTERMFTMAAVGYQWNMEELGKAAFQNIPLTNRRAMAARRAYQQFMWSLTLFGDVAKGLPGLVNYPGIASGLFPADGSGGLRTWASKTPTQMIRDVNSLLTGVFTGSLEIELADTLLMPTALGLYLAQTPLNDNTDVTILDFIKRNNVFTLETQRQLTIRGIRGLTTAGAGGASRIMAYRNEEDAVRLHLPMPHRFLPVYQDGPLNFMVPGIFRTGGVEFSLPGTARYGDGA